MPSSAHTAASTRSAMVPRNLRVRIFMTGLCGFRVTCAAEAGDYKGRAAWFKPWFLADMTTISTSKGPHRAVRWWLISVAVLIALMVLVGGATRLTESGLSIVEWKPVTGSVPPLTEAQWTDAFEAY